MPLLREVWVWPTSGFPDRPWLDDPDDDVFAKLSRAVCDRYSEALPALGLEHRTSHLRLFVDRHDVRVPELARDAPAWFQLFDGRIGFEAAVVGLPAGWRHRALDVRRAEVLDLVHAAVVEMARARGIAGHERLDAAVAHVRAHGHGFTWESPWRRGPRGSGLAARARYRLDDDGFGRCAVDVATVSPEGVPLTVATTAEHLAWTTSLGFTRSARTLRWHGAGLLTVVPSVDLLHAGGSTLLVRVGRPADPTAAPALEESLGDPLPTRPRTTRRERATAVAVPGDVGGQHELAASAKVTDRLAAALDGRTAPEVVERLAGDTSPVVRRAVAARDGAPADLLERLASDSDHQVRGAVAGHPSTPLETVLALAADPAWQVCLTAAERTLPPEALLRLCREASPEARAYLASRPDLGVECALVLARDPVSAVRISLARSIRQHPEAQAVLSDDPNRTVRAALPRR